MRLRKLRYRLVAGSIVATVGLIASAGAASAGPPLHVGPHWFSGKDNQVRGTGSETSYYVMADLAKLYNQSGIFGCTLSSADLRTCTGTDPSDVDDKDNYDHAEINSTLGIGSGNGIGQLCGTKPTGGLPVDFARSSRDFSGDCATSVFKPLARDAIVGISFPLDAPPGAATHGNPAAGWRTGDPVNCGPGGGPACSGRPFSGANNWQDGTWNRTGGGSSVLHKLFCDTGVSHISDWGQLTDPGQPIGSGASIGVPITFWGVNPNSGTKKDWDVFVGNGTACDTNANGITPVLQENASGQIRDRAAAASSDPVVQFNQVTSSLYFMSFAMQLSHQATKANGVKSNKIDNITISGTTIANGTAPTLRTVYNVYRTDTLRGSTAGFLNWIHVEDAAVPPAEHKTDLTTNTNYWDEIKSTIENSWGFVRLTGGTAIPTGDVFDTNT